MLDSTQDFTFLWIGSSITQGFNRCLLSMRKDFFEFIQGIPFKHFSNKSILKFKFYLICYLGLIFVYLMKNMSMLPAFEQWIAHFINICVWFAGSNFGFPSHSGQQLAWKVGSLSLRYFITAWFNYLQIQSFRSNYF